jgi:hypothetical protein
VLPGRRRAPFAGDSDLRAAGSMSKVVFQADSATLFSGSVDDAGMKAGH